MDAKNRAFDEEAGLLEMYMARVDQFGKLTVDELMELCGELELKLKRSNLYALMQFKMVRDGLDFQTFSTNIELSPEKRAYFIGRSEQALMDANVIDGLIEYAQARKKMTSGRGPRIPRDQSSVNQNVEDRGNE